MHVDRIASAWLIRRFIDPDARFKFVSGKGYRPAEGELRFDMFQAEFTHEGDKCTFEVLLDRVAVKDPALRAIAEIIHDIDLRDNKFGREEAVGIRTLIDGIALRRRTTWSASRAAHEVFNNLYEVFGEETSVGRALADRTLIAPMSAAVAHGQETPPLSATDLHARLGTAAAAARDRRAPRPPAANDG